MTESQPTAYRVLARKYRPQDFSGLIGQEALVRTLSNAISSGRLAHAFLLSGVRGVGKTTTARIIARALNCVGSDGDGGPTISPCGVCENCRAIAEGRHVDVLEIDAASHTGVESMRELTDGARYMPVSARFKIYIIDEVHMLSTSSFNALLKTLEEPPEHVKFILATTEPHKVPVTILSRCQKFSLRRVENAVLEKHFAEIAQQEKIAIEPAALAMICRAADGSVRDGLSLLDQAIAHGTELGLVTAEETQIMLGLADGGRMIDLYRLTMKGDISAALAAMQELYNLGVEPSAILAALLEMTHDLTRRKLAAAKTDPAEESSLAKATAEMAQALSIPVLTRNWQILLKGTSEVGAAPRPLQAAEMVLVRLAFAADLPTPSEALKSLKANDSAPQSGLAKSSGAHAGFSPPPKGGASLQIAGGGTSASAPMAYLEQDAEDAQEKVLLPDFPALVAFLAQNNEMKLAAELKSAVHLVHYESGKIEFRLTEKAAPNLAQRLSAALRTLTGKAWLVTLSREQGAKTLRTQELEHESERKQNAAEHPVIRAILKTFPNAKIEAVRDLGRKLEPETETAPYSDDSDLVQGEEDE